MKPFSFFLRTFAFALPAMYLQCGGLNQVQIAGGSGAGNPGGTVSVALSMTVDSMVTQSSVAIDTADTSTTDATAKSAFTVKDMAGLPVSITGVQINSSDLRLVVDDREDPGRILDSINNRPSYLSSDSSSLIINKQFSFNCLKGTPDSSVPPLKMPVARYIGVELNFNQEAPSQTDTEWRSKILITGSFVYNKQLRNFTVDINRTFSPVYPFAGGVFTLSKVDTTHLEIRFNASQWFHRVDFKQCLDQKRLVFGPNGTLFISSNSMATSVLDIESQIRTDFINSGKLVVY
jgi:hypothetical protein